MEKYRHHRHIRPVYYLKYGILPRTVYLLVLPVDLAHGSCREKAKRLPFGKLTQRLTDAEYRHHAFGGVLLRPGINSDKIRSHG